MNDMSQSTKIAIIGGTGREGRGLAYRWAKSGFQILIGSRTPLKATDAALEINQLLDNKHQISGTTNEKAASEAEIIVLTIPYIAHIDTINSIKHFLLGKLVIDVTVPLVPPKVTKVQMPSAGSAAQETKLILGEEVEVAAAFHNISYEHLIGEPGLVSCDVLVTGSSLAARERALTLVKSAGFIGWDAGPLENSVVLEGLTSILIGINRRYGSKNAGIQITGVVRQP